MTEQWIAAPLALDVFGNREAICQRCHAGLIRSRASLLQVDDEQSADVDIPSDFWWADGHEALEQDWDAGDFKTWMNGTAAWRAFGVQFELAGLLSLIPFEEQPAARRKLSVAGSSNWVTARDARRFAYSDAGIQPVTAGQAVIEQCRLGFINARAVEMHMAIGRHASQWTQEAREWDIPTWFWKDFVAAGASTQDWERGIFAGVGPSPRGRASITLNGVHFLKSSLEILLPSHQKTDLSDEEPRKPPLPESELKRWWDRLAPVRESLSQTHLWAIVKADFPNHGVSRDRIRSLAEGRVPGPKVIKPESSA